MSTVTREIDVEKTTIPVREEDRDTHAIGTTLGATAGGIAGAAAGAAMATATGIATGTLLGGPIGGAIGLVAGAVVGGVLGSEVGEAVNPTVEESYWSTTYTREPYYRSIYTYEDYAPAYRVGYEGYRKHPGKSFDEVETRLQDDYIVQRGNSRLDWIDARHATRSAFNRLANRPVPAVG